MDFGIQLSGTYGSMNLAGNTGNPGRYEQVCFFLCKLIAFIYFCTFLFLQDSVLHGEQACQPRSEVYKGWSERSTQKMLLSCEDTKGFTCITCQWVMQNSYTKLLHKTPCRKIDFISLPWTVFAEITWHLVHSIVYLD